MSLEVEQIVKEIDRLPTLNTVAFQVIQLCSDEATSVSDLVKVISSDQSLTAQILRVANSSYFNYPKTVYSLDRAIVILGFNLLKEISVSLSIYSFYRGLKTSKNFAVDELWEHSLTTAFVGRSLAEIYDPGSSELFYVVGLLHDIGKLAMDLMMPKDYSFIIEKAAQEGLRLDIIEKRFLGFHHGDVGGELLRRWNLPDVMVDITRYHHYPKEFDGDAEIFRLIRFNYLSNLLAHYVGDELDGIESVIQLDNNFSDYFSYESNEFEELVRSISESIEKNQSFFQILKS